MTAPPYLKQGDTIAIVAPARKILEEEIKHAIAELESWGLQVVLGEHLFKSDNQYSANDEARASDFQQMLDNTSIKAIIAARGGYGTLRMIDTLDFATFKKHPKWIIGFSDITVLHSHIHQNFSVETIHSLMPIHFHKDEVALETLRKALFGEKLIYTLPSHLLNREGKTNGEITGGNLSIVYALQASRSDISTENKILFIEDVDEYLYHIDRMMVSLKRAGKLAGLKGLIVGGMTDMKDNKTPFGKTAEEIILDAVKEYSYPVCFSFPAGHQPNNCALYFGKRATLEVEKNTAQVFFSSDK
jgi:muramoyltetrapeptide carboxypeptidase